MTVLAHLCHKIFVWLLPTGKEAPPLPTTATPPPLPPPHNSHRHLTKLLCLPAVTMPLSNACLNTVYTGYCAFWQAAADGFTLRITPRNITLSADFSFGEDKPECGH